MIEDRAQHLLPPLWRRGGADHRRFGPAAVIVGQLREAMVVDAQQAGLLQIGLRHQPGPRQIIENAIVEEIDHRPARLILAGPTEHGLLHVVARLQVERREHCRTDAVERQLALDLQRTGDGAAQQDDLHEIVQMSRL